LNDETKRTLRDFFGRAGEWIYDHAAETLAFLIAGTAGTALSLWIHLGVMDERIEHVEERQSSGSLCQRVSDCGAFAEVEHLARGCEKDQMLCGDRLATLNGRMIEVERRLNALRTTPAARPDPFTGADGRILEQRIKALETR
jgi:hypothetical protein